MKALAYKSYFPNVRNLFCTDIIVIIIVLCKNENCAPTKIILTDLQSFYNHNISQNNVFFSFKYFAVLGTIAKVENKTHNRQAANKFTSQSGL